jgi:hypothetical protein
MTSNERTTKGRGEGERAKLDDSGTTLKYFDA